MSRMRWLAISLAMTVASCGTPGNRTPGGGGGSVEAPPNEQAPPPSQSNISQAPTWQITDPIWAHDVSLFADYRFPDVAGFGFLNVAVAPDKTVYAIEYPTRLFSIHPGKTAKHLAGTVARGYVDGPASEARFSGLTGIAVAPDGTVYLSEESYHRLRAVSPDGQSVRTLAGDGFKGSQDGSGTQARFDTPRGIAVDSDGNVYVADGSSTRGHYYETTLRRVTPQGEVSTIMRAVYWNSEYNRLFLYPGPIVIEGHLSRFVQVVTDPAGIVYVADESGRIFALANGKVGYYFDPKNVQGRKAGHDTDVGAAIRLIRSSTGSMYATDGSRVYRMTPDRQIILVAGSQQTTGNQYGTGKEASFRDLSGLAELPDGSLLVSGRAQGIRRLQL